MNQLVGAKEVRTLENILSREYALYKRYREILQQERNALKVKDRTTVTVLAQQRGAMHAELLAAQDDRLLFMRRVAGEEAQTTLREIIKVHFPESDRQHLIEKATKLRALIERTQQEGREYSTLLAFGLRMVHGLKSILFSATQNVVKSYGKKGKIQESFHPSGDQTHVIKEA